MKRIAIASLTLALVAVAGSAQAQTVCPAPDGDVTIWDTEEIVTDTLWNGGTFVLQGPIFVKDGATLSITAGTIVRGQPRSGPVVEGETEGTPGTLIVTQTGRLVAQGTASAPIIMTTAAIDNDTNGVADTSVIPDVGTFESQYSCGDDFLDDTPRTAPLAPLNTAGESNLALWGGLVVLGNAPTNNANRIGVGYGKTTVEGLTFPGFGPDLATYGGVLPHDNSGIIRFVSIRHAGDEIGEGNELNGLSLGAVGDGTVVENVEVYANFDDGVEWFGGTVAGRNLFTHYIGDDSFDLDEGYTGVNQFLFGIQSFFNENDGGSFGSKSGDKACECDGDNFRPDAVAKQDDVNIRVDVLDTIVDPTPWPLSNPALYNLTIIGSTPDAGADFVPTSPASANEGLYFRNGFAGAVFNSVVVNTGTKKAIEVEPGLGLGAPGFDAEVNAVNGLIEVVCSTLDDSAALGALETAVITAGNDLNANLGGGAGGNNVLSIASTAFLRNEDTTFDPTGNAAGKLATALKTAPINPRAQGFSGVGGCVGPQGRGLDGTATFRGAFSTSTNVPLWTDNWTVLNNPGVVLLE